jgi:hypothetical protein
VIAGWNDEPGRGKAEVLAVIEQALDRRVPVRAERLGSAEP